MKRYLIGFVVGICTAGSVAFAADYLLDFEFSLAVQNVVSSCSVNIDLPVTPLIDGQGVVTGRARINC